MLGAQSQQAPVQGSGRLQKTDRARRVQMAHLYVLFRMLTLFKCTKETRKETWKELARICLGSPGLSPEFFLEQERNPLDHPRYAPIQRLSSAVKQQKALILLLDGGEANAFITVLQSVSHISPQSVVKLTYIVE